MPYNIDLEYRVDRLAPRFGDIAKKKMFGGICYLMNGNMCFGIYEDSLIIRTTPEQGEKLLKEDGFSVFDITGKPMKGWVLASLDVTETEGQLLQMLKIGADYAKTLPKK